MSSYFSKKIESMQKDLEELKEYISKKNKAEDNSASSLFDFDLDSMAFEIPEGVDPDDAIDKILHIDSSLARKEEEDLPKLQEGTIVKRSDGRYMCKYFDNKRPKYVYGHTKNEALSKLRAAIQSRDENRSMVKVKVLSLNQWISEWISLYKVPKLKETSLQNIDYTLVRSAARSAIGSMDVSKITALDIERFLYSIEKKATRARTFVFLNEAFSKLVINRVIKENPCEYVDRPRQPVQKKKTDIPDYDDVHEFMDWLDHNHSDFAKVIRFIASSGMRRGEALALTWEDIDFENDIITISKSYNQNTGKTTSPKTNASIRSIPLFPEAREVLESLKKDNPIFKTQQDMALTTRMKNYTKEFGIKLNIHGLRHFFTSQCYMAGIPEKVVQTWLGHEKITVTMNTYTHISSLFEQDAIRKMAEFWDNKRKK